VTRIGFADHLFLRMHHGIGYPVYNQFLWWFDESVQRIDLEKLRDNLSDGLLARRVVASTVPGARDRWVASNVSHSLDFHPHFIESTDVLAWADGCLDRDIDPETGLGWRLAAAPLANGGTVLSLVASHMVADGGALIAAFGAANSSSEQPRSVPAADGIAAAIGSDLRDAVEQAWSVAGWLVNTAASALPIPTRPGPDAAVPRSQPTRSQPTAGAVNADWVSPHAVAEVDADAWKATAQRWGGTSNSLFIAVLTAASGQAGRASIGDSVQWSLPVSDRTADDTRSNATKIVKIEVPVTDAADRDLSTIRTTSKAAFTAFAARQAAGLPPAGISQALVQMLPDAVVARVPQPRDGAEGLASNLGVLPEVFTTVAGIRARAVSGRATFAGADAAFARSLDGGLTAWVCETGASVTVTVHAMDPDRFADDQALRDHLAEALGRWELTARFW